MEDEDFNSTIVPSADLNSRTVLPPKIYHHDYHQYEYFKNKNLLDSFIVYLEVLVLDILSLFFFIFTLNVFVE